MRRASVEGTATVFASPRPSGGARARIARCAGVTAATVAFILAMGTIEPALAEDDSRVVVVAPSPNGTKVPVGPDEKVGAVTVVAPAGAGPVVVVRVDKMEKKADFNIITPDGVSHPFTDGDSGVEGITVTHEPQVVQDRDGRTWYQVVSCFKKGGTQVGCAKVEFPPGSQLQHDPPQPPGTGFVCPDAVAASADVEQAVLEALGVADDTSTQVWSVPSGELQFSHDQSAGVEVVEYEFEDDASGEPEDEEDEGEETEGEAESEDLLNPFNWCGFGLLNLTPLMLAGLLTLKTARRQLF